MRLFQDWCAVGEVTYKMWMAPPHLLPTVFVVEVHHECLDISSCLVLDNFHQCANGSIGQGIFDIQVYSQHDPAALLHLKIVYELL